MFKGVEDALRYAYRVEGRSICKISSVFSDMRGSVVKSKGQDPWDRLTEAAYIIMISERCLTPSLKVLVRGFYTSPSKIVIKRKHKDISAISKAAWEMMSTRIDRYLVEDIVRGWVGLRRHHTDDWWRRHLGITQHQFYVIVNGRKNRRRRGIVQYLDEQLYGAHGLIEPEFYQANIIS